MSRHFWLVAVLLSLPAFAGKVYKSVGSDGQVVYSEQPPADPDQAKTLDIRAQPTRAESDPVKAAMMVYAKSVVVESMTQWCAQEVPSTRLAVKQAHGAWGQRHATLIQRVTPILKDNLSVGQRSAIAAMTMKDTEAVLRQMSAAPEADRVKWCTEAPRRMAAPEMNLVGNLTLVNTIMGYRRKP